jgi:hypothetical protein
VVEALPAPNKKSLWGISWQPHQHDSSPNVETLLQRENPTSASFRDQVAIDQVPNNKIWRKLCFALLCFAGMGWDGMGWDGEGMKTSLTGESVGSSFWFAVTGSRKPMNKHGRS